MRMVCCYVYLINQGYSIIFFNLNNITQYLLMNSFKILAGGGVPIPVPSLVGISIFFQSKAGDALSVETACSTFDLIIVNPDYVGWGTL